MQDENENQTHPFLRTLGPGPYRFVGTFDLGKAVAALHAGNVNGYNNALSRAPQVESGMGTCSHCGHAITFICVVETGEKRRFGVGSDCILKAGLPVQELTKLQKAERERQKELRAARKVKKGNAARETLTDLIMSQGEVLAKLPHPTEYRAKLGDSLKDYANWIVDNSNDGGVVIALKKIEFLISKQNAEVSK